MPKTTNILIVQDHDLIRTAIEFFFKDNSTYNVVGTVANGKDTLKLLKQVHVDIILLDIEMDVMNGKETLLKVNKKYPETKVIMLSKINQVAVKLEFIKLGAKAFVSTRDTMQTLFEAINGVLEKGYWLSDGLTESLIKTQTISTYDSLKNLSLTPRELEVLEYLCEGYTDKEIAKKLHLSSHTTHAHRRNIFLKTNSHTIGQLVNHVYKKK